MLLIRVRCDDYVIGVVMKNLHTGFRIRSLLLFVFGVSALFAVSALGFSETTPKSPTHVISKERGRMEGSC